MSSPSPTRRASGAWPPWRRTLLVAFGAQTLALMGFTLIFPFLPLYVQTLGVHGRAVPAWAGIISFSASLPLVVMGPVWDALGDRYGRKPMVIRAMASGAVTMSLLIVAPNIWVLVALLMLAGFFTGVALGPLAGGVLNDHLGFRVTFACSAGLLLAAALLVLCGLEEGFVRPVPARGQSVLTPFKTFLAVAVSPGVLLMALVLFMVQTSSMTPAAVLPLFVPHLQGVPVVHGVAQTSTAVGLILAVAGLCAALASWLAPRLIDRYGYRRGLIGGPGPGGALLGVRAVFPITAAALLGVAIVVARLVQEPQELVEGSATQPVAAARLSAK